VARQLCWVRYGLSFLRGQIWNVNYERLGRAWFVNYEWIGKVW